MAAHHGADLPPAPGQGVNSVGLQQVAGQEQKKSKFGKLGNTVSKFSSTLLLFSMYFLLITAMYRWQIQLRVVLVSELVLLLEVALSELSSDFFLRCITFSLGLEIFI